MSQDPTTPAFIAYLARLKPTEERNREILALMAQAPKRSIEEQRDVDGLALFDVVRAPRLI